MKKMSKKIILTSLMALVIAPSVLAMNYKEAKNQSKPIVVYVYMKQCGACKGFTPIYETASAKYSAKFNFVKELIEGSEVAKKMHPSSVPSVYIVEPKKNITKTISYECASDKACFEQTLDSYK